MANQKDESVIHCEDIRGGKPYVKGKTVSEALTPAGMAKIKQLAFDSAFEANYSSVWQDRYDFIVANMSGEVDSFNAENRAHFEEIMREVEYKMTDRKS